MVTSRFKIFTSLNSFIYSSLVQWDIYPAAELALLVPDRLSVSHENHSICPLLFLFDKGLFGLISIHISNALLIVISFLRLSSEKGVQFLLDVV